MSDVQSALHPAGAHAEAIGRLWDVFLIVTAVVYVLVMIALVVALLRRRHPSDETPRTTTTVVSVATGITTLILFALLIASILTGRSIAEVPSHDAQIIVTGRQWWWQVEYDDRDPSRRVASANELVIPVGARVNVQLRSTDVIHSFWVPNLHGKRDLIPGHDASLTLQATRAGLYRGQCAEFCGQQHAKMALWVRALPPAHYAQWLAAQRQPARTPTTPAERAGQQVFLRSPCPLCHNIQGTDASGKTAPDLTHFASRRSIAAAALPQSRAALAEWIVDPQHVKPGSYMPPTVLTADELQSLIAYLESLR